MSDQKKPYSRPALISYGLVKEIVQTGGGGMSDGLHTCKNVCWIADVLYGVEHPRTLLLRARLKLVLSRKERGWLFAAMYRRFGRQTAGLIARGLLPRWLFAPLFDRLTDWALNEWAAIIRYGELRRPV